MDNTNDRLNKRNPKKAKIERAIILFLQIILGIFITVSIYNDFSDDENSICIGMNNFVLSQKGTVVVSKKWRSTLERVYIVEGSDLIGKKSQLKFYTPDIFESVKVGDTLVKCQKDSVYQLHKKGLIIKYIDVCKTFKIDSVSTSF